MGTLILREDSSSFSTDNAARMAAGRKKLKNFTIVPHNGGYAINVEEEIQMDTSATVMEIPATVVASPPVEESLRFTISRPVNVAVKHIVTSPWQPARVLDIPERLKDPNFIYRWCDKNKPGNIQKKLHEGWEIDKEISKKLLAIAAVRTVNDGSPLDSTAQVRELVVMRLPKDRADARNQYYRERSDMAAKEAQEKLRRETDGRVYGESKEERY